MIAISPNALQAQTAEKFSIGVSDNMLSVKAENARFGSIMNEIAAQAGFELSVSKEVSVKTLSTNFDDVDLLRGINRLLSLISQKNFFIHYGADGVISKIEILSSEKSKPEISRPPRWQAPTAPVHTRPVVPPPVPPPTEEEEDYDQAVTGEDLENVYETEGQVDTGEDSNATRPYIPPRVPPRYIPPAR